MNYFETIQRRRHERQENARRAAKLGEHLHILRAGMTAFVQGFTPVDCPHVLDTPKQRAWLAGWLNGYDRRRQA